MKTSTILTIICSLCLIHSASFAQLEIVRDFDGSDFDVIVNDMTATSDSIYLVTSAGGDNDLGALIRMDENGDGYIS